MKTIKVNRLGEIPENFTGIVEWENGDKWWYENDKLHREDGPAKTLIEGYKSWWLNGNYIWNSDYEKFDLRNTIVLSKDPHPLYPTVQVWKYLDMEGIKEQIIIPGMEEWFTE